MIKVLVERSTVEKAYEFIKNAIDLYTDLFKNGVPADYIELENKLKEPLQTLGINDKRYYIFCNGRWLEKGFDTIQGCISYIRRNKIHNCSIYNYYVFVKNLGKQMNAGFIKEFR